MIYFGFVTIHVTSKHGGVNQNVFDPIHDLWNVFAQNETTENCKHEERRWPKARERETEIEIDREGFRFSLQWFPFFRAWILHIW